MGVVAGVMVLSSVCVLAAAVARPPAQQGAQGAQAQQPPPGQTRAGGAPPAMPKNIQVLPKDWNSTQVQTFMRAYFTPGLGFVCNDCHLPNDRAADDKKEKQTARQMLRMMMAANDTFLKDVGEPAAAGTFKVTCYTCHRGTRKPLNAPPPAGGGF